jgi:hypothetical protein
MCNENTVENHSGWRMCRGNAATMATRALYRGQSVCLRAGMRMRIVAAHVSPVQSSNLQHPDLVQSVVGQTLTGPLRHINTVRYALSPSIDVGPVSRGAGDHWTPIHAITTLDAINIIYLYVYIIEQDNWEFMWGITPQTVCTYNRCIRLVAEQLTVEFHNTAKWGASLLIFTPWTKPFQISGNNEMTPYSVVPHLLFRQL